MSIPPTLQQLLRHALLFGLIGASHACTPSRSLPPVQPADEIVVNYDSDEVWRVSDAATIETIRSLVNTHLDDWTVEAMGPPIARTRLDFYLNGKFVGNFGIGGDYFTRAVGDFYSRDANPRDIDALLAALMFEPGIH